ncbi:protein phosphatase 2c, putative [Ichthyophthirius multifiliis]|uniref:Protein phosphatase 2c, putative n=1 Tax=Ichthyophthirius multifiliis TaxID=5932 RepID=G0QZC9_ICHMU|nr:protein phosphatase 2c, putative [Ichthyophthirius multifiliis]EGR29432.1 protein phosphatase 2c, putative [Ichthyophthirius multifiliis]|eukprot:XP_004030668.1 protein phosphatase 2c, putative [Ichthyophthirius multifiliis]
MNKTIDVKQKHDNTTFIIRKNSQLQSPLKQYLTPQIKASFNQDCNISCSPNKLVSVFQFEVEQPQPVQDNTDQQSYNYSYQDARVNLKKSIYINVILLLINRNFIIFFQFKKGNLKKIQIISNSKSRPGQYSPNIQKTNQDSIINMVQLGTDKTFCFYGVCDGHGEYGDQVSNHIKKKLSQILLKNIKISQQQKANELNLQNTLNKTLKQVSQELLDSKMDTYLSGSTSVTILIHNNTLYCTNIGDSRAIIGRLVNKGGGKNEWKSIQLSEDHKPNLAREKKRILEHGGRVEIQTDEKGQKQGVYRVWNQKMEYPGLAMSRSLGDKAGREVGIISEPDIYELLIQEEDKFIVIASDGVWEFMSNSDQIEYY